MQQTSYWFKQIVLWNSIRIPSALRPSIWNLYCAPMPGQLNYFEISQTVRLLTGKSLLGEAVFEEELYGKEYEESYQYTFNGELLRAGLGTLEPPQQFKRYAAIVVVAKRISVPAIKFKIWNPTFWIRSKPYSSS